MIGRRTERTISHIEGSPSPTDVGSAPLHFVQADDGVTYAYKRFGPRTGTPVLFLPGLEEHMEDCNPWMIDAVSAKHDVILFDNAGIGHSGGTTPDVVEAMAEDAITFASALALPAVDLFGCSLGGFLAQDIALAHPRFARRLILADTSPKGAPGLERWLSIVDRPEQESSIDVSRSPSHSNGAPGIRPTIRIDGLLGGLNKEPSSEVKYAQARAVLHWGHENWPEVQRLTRITHPSLILSRDDDATIPTKASYLLAALIPESRIHTIPDTAQSSDHQFETDAATEVLAFLGD